METDPTRMCEKLVGLGDVDLVGINDSGEQPPIGVVIRSRKARPTCEACGGRVWSKGIGQPCWLICRRSVVRCVCGGGNAAGRVRTPTVRRSRSSSKTPRSPRRGRC